MPPLPIEASGDYIDEPELTDDELAHFKQRLLDESAKVRGRLQRHTDDALNEVEPIAEEGDQALHMYEQAYNLRLADKERKLLNLIARALTKIDEGEYGICEGTGDPIPRKRLEIRPWTRYSVEHKERLEREQGKQHRR